METLDKKLAQSQFFPVKHPPWISSTSCSPSTLDVIVRETNKNALQCLASSGKNPSSFDKVTEIEMLAYLGLIIAMSLHSLHCIRDYWSTEWVLGIPTLARIFTVARFEIITGTCISITIQKCQQEGALILTNYI